jgi:hypothetical protein
MWNFEEPYLSGSPLQQKGAQVSRQRQQASERQSHQRGRVLIHEILRRYDILSQPLTDKHTDLTADAFLSP